MLAGDGYFEARAFAFLFGDFFIEKMIDGEVRMIAIVEITEICNMNCIYCYEGCSHSNGNEMSPQDFNKILQNTGYVVDDYVISGGEPFMHTSWGSIIEILKSHNRKIHFISNGTFLDSIISCNYKWDTLTISLDSFDHAHNRLRDKFSPPSKEMIKKVLETNRVEQLFLQLILSRENCKRENFKDILLFCDENRIGLKCKLLDGFSDRRILKYCLSKNEVSLAISCMKEIMLEHSLSVKVDWPPLDNIFCECAILNEKPNIRIKANGSMYGCEKANNEDFFIGNAYIESDYLQELRKVKARILQRLIVMTKKTCVKCKNNATCNKGCPILFNPSNKYIQCTNGMTYEK